jgi:glycine/D-amino acid oxidase-like deaminating enzyme
LHGSHKLKISPSFIMTLIKKLSAVLLATLLLCSSRVQGSDHHDVIVIGLGWAGIGAGYELQRFNNLTDSIFGVDEVAPIDFKCLDVERYYGGRALAAHWFSGGDGNPIAELAFQLFSQNPNDEDYLLYTNQKWSDASYFTTTGEEIRRNDLNSARRKWSEAYTCLQEEALAGFVGSMRDALEGTCDWHVNTDEGDLLNILEWYDLDYEYTVTAENMSPFGNLPLYAYDEFTGQDWFVSTPNNGADIADKVVKTFIKDYETTAQLNTSVTEIDWTTSPVKVTTSSGSHNATRVSKRRPKCVETYNMIPSTHSVCTV